MTSFTHYFKISACNCSLLYMQNTSLKVRKAETPVLHMKSATYTRIAFLSLVHTFDSNRPFPSCCLSRFQSESWCSTIVREMSLICIRIRNSFPFEWLCTRTRFETEAYSNSEMGYSNANEVHSSNANARK